MTPPGGLLALRPKGGYDGGGTPRGSLGGSCHHRAALAQAELRKRIAGGVCDALGGRAEAQSPPLLRAYLMLPKAARVRLPADGGGGGRGVGATFYSRGLRARSAAARSAVTNFEGRARAGGVLYQSEIIRAGPSDFADRFARRARTCDLSVVPQSDPSANGWDTALIEAVLFDLGRPVLIVPYVYTGEPRFNKILVAWDGSKAAARAVHDALPLLAYARTVELLTIFTERHRPENVIPGADLATHLARHGLNVTASSTDASEIGIAEAMLSHVADSGTDLIVMGGYAHSRLRHLVFGGATSGNPEVDDRSCPHGALIGLASLVVSRAQSSNFGRLCSRTGGTSGQPGPAVPPMNPAQRPLNRLERASATCEYCARRR